MLIDTTDGSAGVPSTSAQHVLSNGVSGAFSTVKSFSSWDYNLDVDSGGSELRVLHLTITTSVKNDSVIVSRSCDRSSIL